MATAEAVRQQERELPAKTVAWLAQVLYLPLKRVVLRRGAALLVMANGEECEVPLEALESQASFRKRLLREALCPRRVPADAWDMVVRTIVRYARD